MIFFLLRRMRIAHLLLGRRIIYATLPFDNRKRKITDHSIVLSATPLVQDPTVGCSEL
jgi:hypothetical protein